MLHAVILAGGSGTRFWPLSRAARPKQLLDLTGGRTMIQATFDRLTGLVPPERTLVVTNRSLVGPIAEQLPEVPRARIVGEPCKRDTAPAIGLAAVLVSQGDPDAVMITMPADHLIQPTDAFQTALRQAVAMVEARPETFVTFGVKPTYAAESFGYIERGDHSPLTTHHSPIYSVTRFREKPARSVAEEYLASGNFYWNSGIFVWKARTILDAISRYEPQIGAQLAKIAAAAGKADFELILDREFTGIRGKSIDFAVMEHYQPVVVIEAPFTWDDIGSWQALGRAAGADENGNTAIGKHLGIRTQGSIIRTSGNHLVVTLGVKDCVVVHTSDATLVASKQEEEAIREVVKALEERAWKEYL